MSIFKGLFSSESNPRYFRRLQTTKDIKKISDILIDCHLNGFKGDIRNLPLFLSEKISSGWYLYVPTYLTCDIGKLSRYKKYMAPANCVFFYPLLSMHLFPFKPDGPFLEFSGDQNICRVAVDKFVFCENMIIVPTIMHYIKMLLILYNNNYSAEHYYNYKVMYAHSGVRYLNYGTSGLYKAFSDGCNNVYLFIDKKLGLEHDIDSENTLTKYGFKNLVIFDIKVLDAIQSRKELEEYLKYGTRLV